MKKITYKIELLSDWHCGSGLSGGAGSNAMVIKDDRAIPFIPGKTMKGLLKEALLEICEVKGEAFEKNYSKLFEESYTNNRSEGLFFSNAIVKKEEADEIVSNNLQTFLYRNITSTAIESTGEAKVHSLRTIEVCMPINLEGFINGVEDDEILKNAFKMIRHLGVNRNRGLGRCKIIITSNDIQP